MKRVFIMISVCVCLFGVSSACGSARTGYDTLTQEQQAQIDCIYAARNVWETNHTTYVSRTTYDGQRAFFVQNIETENTEGSYGWKYTYTYDDNSVTCVDSEYVGIMLAFNANGTQERVIQTNWDTGASEQRKKNTLAEILFGS